MRKLLLGISFGLAWVVSASASAAPLQNSLFFDGSGVAANGQAIVTGHLQIAKAKCVSGRKIDVYFSFENSSEFGRVDRAVSSANGAFAGTGPATDISSNPLDAVMLKLKRVVYGHGPSRTVCNKAAIVAN